jgi:hypothetical protein
MRVSTIVFILIVIALLVGGAWFIFGGIDGFQKFVAGFQSASTPTEAMEQFRDAIQKRKYRWAATYCTKDYGDILVKTDAEAARLGRTIDKIREFMEAGKLQTDQCVVLLNSLDPFPGNFKVQGVVKEINDKEASGSFAWEPLQLSNQNPTVDSRVDPKMCQRALMPRAFFNTPIKIVKDSEGWKLDIPVAPMVDSVRYFQDHAKTYHSELQTFQTYMTNGRYDNPKAFEGELLDALRKANAR